MSRSLSLEQKLLAQGVSSDVVKACCSIFGNYEEAKPYLAGSCPGIPGGDVKEFWSLKYHRYYYQAGDAATTTWEFPPQLQLSEWLLDASMSGLDGAACRKLLGAVLWAVQANAHKGEALWSALELLARLTGNVVDCGNTLDKYRTVRKSNARIREALDVLSGSGEAVLLAAGFVAPPGSDSLMFPPEGSDLRPLTLVNAKLRQLVAHKGFTGVARECDDTGTTTASRHSGTPGFRHQQVIFECSCCSRPINDGTERLLTRKHEAPRGEFRYECESCPGYNLCEGCWDEFIAGGLSPAHPREHAFATHHPKAAQHNLQSSESAANPWGIKLAGGSAARARERLKDRTGL